MKSLTKRQKQILSIMAEGEPNKVIAQRLGIKTTTVKTHIDAILEKLDAKGRTHAVAEAIRKGVIT